MKRDEPEPAPGPFDGSLTRCSRLCIMRPGFNAVVKSDFEQTEKVREIPNRARKELEAL